MAQLSDADRQQVTRFWINEAFVKIQATARFSHDEVKPATDATDAWIEANQNSFNVALPEPFKSQATFDEKTLLFCAVALKRAKLLA